MLEFFKNLSGFNQCCGSALVSMRIQIQLLTSMRMRIQGAKTMPIHADPDPGQTLPSQKSWILT
jgi:hypothetical protein